MPRYGRRYRRRFRRRPRRYRRKFRRGGRYRRPRDVGHARAKFTMVAFNQTAAATAGQTEFWTGESYTLDGYVPITALSPYTNGYDFYSIRKIKLEFYMHPVVPNSNSGWNIDTAQTQNIWFAGAVDLNDITPPTDIEYFSSVQNPKIVSLSPSNRKKFCKFYWKPTILIDSLNSPAMIKKSPWIGTDQLAIQHYGIKFGFQTAVGLTVNQRIFFATKLTFYVKFRNRAGQASGV